jgi:AcrR family transcriptional regulator
MDATLHVLNHDSELEGKRFRLSGTALPALRNGGAAGKGTRVYRQTARTRANAVQRREGLEQAARHVVARGGFTAASISAVSAEAGCSAGLVYSYFDSRDELLAAVFAQASTHELAVVAAVAQEARSLADFIDAVVRAFVERAVAGHTLAYALLFEPVPESVQRERIRLRAGYAAAIAEGFRRAAHSEAARSDAGSGMGKPLGVCPEIAARALMGAVVENLFILLSGDGPAPTRSQVERLISEISTYSRRALGAA